MGLILRHIGMVITMLLVSDQQKIATLNLKIYTWETSLKMETIHYHIWILIKITGPNKTAQIV